MSRYGDPGHEEWLIEQERDDEAKGYLAHQEVMAEIGRRETEGLDDGIGGYDEPTEEEKADWAAEMAAEDEVERLAAQQFPEYLSPSSPYYADAQQTIVGRYLDALHKAAQADDEDGGYAGLDVDPSLTISDEDVRPF